MLYGAWGERDRHGLPSSARRPVANAHARDHVNLLPTTRFAPDRATRGALATVMPTARSGDAVLGSASPSSQKRNPLRRSQKKPQQSLRVRVFAWRGRLGPFRVATTDHVRVHGILRLVACQLGTPVGRQLPLRFRTGGGLGEGCLRFIQHPLCRGGRSLGFLDVFLRLGGAQLQPATQPLWGPCAPNLLSAESDTAPQILDLMLHSRVGALLQTAEVRLPSPNFLHQLVLNHASWARCGHGRTVASSSTQSGELRVLLRQARPQKLQLITWPTWPRA